MALLAIRVRRGPGGLGLGVANDLISDLKAGGQAERDGLLCVGDEIVAIDGVLLAGRPMASALPRGAAECEFIVRRRDGALSTSFVRLPADEPVAKLRASGTPLRVLRLTVARAGGQKLGLDMSGANVLKRVLPGGAAEKSGGFAAGDVVIAVDGVAVGDKKLVQLIQPGDAPLSFTVLRAEASAAAPPAAASAAAATPAAVKATRDELLYVRVTRGANNGLGLALDECNIVSQLAPGGQAALDDLLALGDEIVSVDGALLNGRYGASVFPGSAAAYETVVRRRDGALSTSLARLPADEAAGVAAAAARLRASGFPLRVLRLTVNRAGGAKLGLDMSGANVVMRVLPGGAAEKSGGFAAGDVVVAVDGVRIGDRKLIDGGIIQPGDSPISLTVVRAEAAPPTPTAPPAPPPPAVVTDDQLLAFLLGRLGLTRAAAVDLYKGEAKLESTRRLPAAETAPGAVAAATAAATAAAAAATAALPKATDEPPPEEPPASNDYPVGPDDGLPMDQDGAGNDYL